MPHPAQISPDEPRETYEPWNYAGSADDDKEEPCDFDGQCGGLSVE